MEGQAIETARSSGDGLVDCEAAQLVDATLSKEQLEEAARLAKDTALREQIARLGLPLPSDASREEVSLYLAYRAAAAEARRLGLPAGTTPRELTIFFEDRTLYGLLGKTAFDH